MIFILAVVIFIVVSCNKVQHPKEMVKAYELGLDFPDSALSILDKMKPQVNGMNKSDRMFYTLAYAKAKNVAYKPLPAGDTLQNLVSYYNKSLTERHLLPEAFYCLGRKYFKEDKYIQALDCFQKTLSLTKDTPEHYEMRCRVYSQLGQIDEIQNLYDNAISNYKQSLSYAYRCKDTTSAIFALRDIGAIYLWKERRKTALNYTLRSLQLAKEQGNKKMYADVSSQVATIYIELNQLQKAWKYLQTAIEYDDPNDRRAVQVIKALFFLKNEEKDSAMTCFRNAIKFNDAYANQTAYRNLSLYYIEKSDKINALKYFHGFIKSIERLNDIKVSKSVALMHGLYNSREKDRENAELKTKIYILSIGMILFIVFAVGLYLYIRKRIREHELQKERLNIINESQTLQIQKEEAEMESLKKEIERISLQLASSKETNAQLEDVLKKLQQKLSKEEKCTNEEQHRKDLEMAGTAIYKYFHEQAAKGEKCEKGFPRKKDLDELSKAINNIYKNFSLKLLGLCNMSELDTNTCLLLKIKLRPNDIALMMGKSREGINSIRKKLYKRAFGEDKGAKAWDEVINRL